jgi:hypothetical protein
VGAVCERERERERETDRQTEVLSTIKKWLKVGKYKREREREVLLTMNT